VGQAEELAFRRLSWRLVLKAWVQAHADQIELQFLPGYSPELNPTELLNQDVKTNALGRRRPHTQNQMIGDTRSYLRCTQRKPPARRTLLPRERRRLRQSSMTPIY